MSPAPMPSAESVGTSAAIKTKLSLKHQNYYFLICALISAKIDVKTRQLHRRLKLTPRVCSVTYSQAKSSVPPKITLMNLLFES